MQQISDNEGRHSIDNNAPSSSSPAGPPQLQNENQMETILNPDRLVLTNQF